MCPIERAALYGWPIVYPIEKVTLYGWSVVCPIEQVTLYGWSILSAMHREGYTVWVVHREGCSIQ